MASSLFRRFKDDDRLNAIWAIASLIAASEPVMKHAMRMARPSLINTTVGCGVGLAVLLIGGRSEWRLPIAISIAVLISSYFVRIPNMGRQAPITAAIIIASELAQHSSRTGMEQGLGRVA